MTIGLIFFIGIPYLLFTHVMCYARTGKSLFYIFSNFFRKLEAAQRTIINRIPVWLQDYKREYQKKLKKVGQELVIE